MDREQLLRALRKYARKNGLEFEIDVGHGKGSHYMVRVGTARTTIPANVHPVLVRAILKQLGIDPAAI